MKLSHQNTTTRGSSEYPYELNLDLSQTPPGSQVLWLHQAGTPVVAVPARVLPPKIKVEQLTHAEWDEFLNIRGKHLERLDHVLLRSATCRPSASDEPLLPGISSVQLFCDRDIRNNTSLPELAFVVHVDHEPMAVRTPLIKHPAKPKLDIATDTPNALLTVPSAKALQWQLAVDDVLMSEDSGLHVLLKTQSPYLLVKGNYVLQLRFTDDPQSTAEPIVAPLMANFTHQELRTLNPVLFNGTRLPGVINPLEFRVEHQPSGQSSEWQPLPRAVLLLPHLQNLLCTQMAQTWWIEGKHLDLIDGLRWPGTENETTGFVPPTLVPCASGLCLRLSSWPAKGMLDIRLRWVDQRSFSVRLPQTPPLDCPVLP
jgi:hypothetical protein